MGLREKVALGLIAVILQTSCTTSKPQLVKTNPFERYTKKFGKGNISNTVIKTPYYNGRSNKHAAETLTNSNLYKAFNFPEVDFPSDTFNKDPFTFSPRSISSSQLSEKKSILLDNFRKEARKKRKSKLHVKKDVSKQTQFEPHQHPIYATEMKGFPQVEYPLSAMDALAKKYWNPLPYNTDDSYIKTNVVENVQSKQDTQQIYPHTYNNPSNMKGNKGILAVLGNSKNKNNKKVPTENTHDSKNGKITIESPEGAAITKKRNDLLNIGSVTPRPSTVSQVRRKSQKPTNIQVSQRKRNKNGRIPSKSLQPSSEFKPHRTKTRTTDINNFECSIKNSLNQSIPTCPADTSNQTVSDISTYTSLITNDTILGNPYSLSLLPNNDRFHFDSSSQPSLISGECPNDVICESPKVVPDTILSNEIVKQSTSESFNTSATQESYLDIKNESKTFNGEQFDNAGLLASQLSVRNSSELRDFAEMILAQVGPIPKQFAELINPLHPNDFTSSSPTFHQHLPIERESIKDVTTNNYLNPLATEYVLNNSLITNKLSAKIQRDESILPTEFVLPNVVTTSEILNKDSLAVPLSDLIRTIKHEEFNNSNLLFKTLDLSSDISADLNSLTLKNHLDPSLLPRVISDLSALNYLVQNILQEDVFPKSNLSNDYQNKAISSIDLLPTEYIILDSSLNNKLSDSDDNSITIPKEQCVSGPLKTNCNDLNEKLLSNHYEYTESLLFPNNQTFTSINESDKCESTSTTIFNLSKTLNESVDKSELYQSFHKNLNEQPLISSENNNNTPEINLCCPVLNIDQCSAYDQTEANISNNDIMLNTSLMEILSEQKTQNTSNFPINSIVNYDYFIQTQPHLEAILDLGVNNTQNVTRSTNATTIQDFSSSLIDMTIQSDFDEQKPQPDLAHNNSTLELPDTLNSKTQANNVPEYNAHLIGPNNYTDSILVEKNALLKIASAEALSNNMSDIMTSSLEESNSPNAPPFHTIENVLHEPVSDVISHASSETHKHGVISHMPYTSATHVIFDEDVVLNRTDAYAVSDANEITEVRDTLNLEDALDMLDGIILPSEFEQDVKLDIPNKHNTNMLNFDKTPRINNTETLLDKFNTDVNKSITDVPDTKQVTNINVIENAGISQDLTKNYLTKTVLDMFDTHTKLDGPELKTIPTIFDTDIIKSMTDSNKLSNMTSADVDYQDILDTDGTSDINASLVDNISHLPPEMINSDAFSRMQGTNNDIPTLTEVENLLDKPESDTLSNIPNITKTLLEMPHDSSPNYVLLPNTTSVALLSNLDTETILNILDLNMLPEMPDKTVPNAETLQGTATNSLNNIATNNVPETAILPAMPNTDELKNKLNIISKPTLPYTDMFQGMSNRNAFQRMSSFIKLPDIHYNVALNLFRAENITNIFDAIKLPNNTFGDMFETEKVPNSSDDYTLVNMSDYGAVPDIYNNASSDALSGIHDKKRLAIIPDTFTLVDDTFPNGSLTVIREAKMIPDPNEVTDILVVSLDVLPDMPNTQNLPAIPEIVALPDDALNVTFESEKLPDTFTLTNMQGLGPLLETHAISLDAFSDMVDKEIAAISSTVTSVDRNLQTDSLPNMLETEKLSDIPYTFTLPIMPDSDELSDIDDNVSGDAPLDLLDTDELTDKSIKGTIQNVYASEV